MGIRLGERADFLKLKIQGQHVQRTCKGGRISWSTTVYFSSKPSFM